MNHVDSMFASIFCLPSSFCNFWIFTPSGRRNKFSKKYPSKVSFEGEMSQHLVSYIASKPCAVQKHPYYDSQWAKYGVQYLLRIFQTEKTGLKIYRLSHFTMKVGGIVQFCVIIVLFMFVSRLTLQKVYCKK